MTEMGKPDGTAGPPWSVDLLADLHAGALDEARAAELWPRVQADPEAAAVLRALDATQSDLATLVHAPAPPMPAHFAARLDAALAAEAARATPAPFAAPAPVAEQQGRPQGLAPVVDLAAARRRRNRIAGWGAGIATAAAAAVAAIAFFGPGTTTTGTPLAGGNADGSADGSEPTQSEAPPGAGPGEVQVDPQNPASAFGDINGVQDFGPLQSREGLDACLQANDIPTTGQTAGVKPGKVEGKDAVIAVLTTGEIARFRIIAVSPDCSAENPGEVYLDKEFGR